MLSKFFSFGNRYKKTWKSFFKYYEGQRKKMNLNQHMMISDSAIQHVTLNLLTAQKIAKAAKLSTKDPNVLSYIINHMYDIELDLRKLEMKKQMEEQGIGQQDCCGGSCECNEGKVTITND
jgi:hypothetical protein